MLVVRSIGPTNTHVHAIHLGDLLRVRDRASTVSNLRERDEPLVRVREVLRRTARRTPRRA
jgi:hypothetical protein